MNHTTAREKFHTQFRPWIFWIVVFSIWLMGCATQLAPLATETSLPGFASSTPANLPEETLTSVPPTTTATPLSESERQIMTQRLIQAAEAGEISTVTELLQAGADINGRDEQGRTAAMAATHANQVEAVRLLIEAGADINIQDNRLDNPFLYAGAEGLLDIVKLTIDAQADPRLTNRFGGTALIPASERGHVEIVRELLTRTAVDVNHINNLGWTALLEAIILSDGGVRHQQIVQLLVDHGANINIPDKDGITPLQHAQARGFKEIEQILLTTARTRDLQLIHAAEIGDLEAIRRLVTLGANVHFQDARGVTALIAAAYRNDILIADVLMEAGADVNVQDNTKQSAYLIATSEGFLELLRRTLQAGANVHSTDSYNGTGLIRAADRGHVEIIQELLKTDINIDHINNLGWTALLEAIILGDGGARHSEVVRLLVEAGADVNLADANGITPLTHAKYRGHEAIIQILSAAGAY